MQEAQEKTLGTTCHWGNANQSHVRCHLAPVRRLLRKEEEKANRPGARGEGTMCTAGGSQTGAAAGNSTEVPQKTRNRSHSPARPPLGVCPEETGSDVQETPAAFTGTGAWGSLVSISGWLGKGARARTEYYSGFKKQILRPHVQAWTTSALKEISHTRKEKRVTSLMCAPKTVDTWKSGRDLRVQVQSTAVQERRVDARFTDTLLDPGHSLRQQMPVTLTPDGSPCEGTAVRCTVRVASCQTPHTSRV